MKIVEEKYSNNAVNEDTVMTVNTHTDSLGPFISLNGF